MNAKDLSSIIATWVGVIAGIVGGYAAYLQYEKSVDAQVDGRSLTAINFVIQFQSEHFMPIREKLYNYIFCTDPQNCAAAKPTNSQIFAFVEFLDTVKYCSDKNVCDREIIHDVFSPYASGHWPCLAEHVHYIRSAEAELRLGRPYGVGFEELAPRGASDKHCGNITRKSEFR